MDDTIIKVIKYALPSVIVLGIFWGLVYLFYDKKMDMPPAQVKTEQAIKVAVTAGPHAIIMEKVKETALAQGLEIEIVEFNDFVLPNVALDEGDVDMNCYQHLPFLKEQVETRRFNIREFGKTVLMPMGLYSKTLKTIDELKAGDKVLIPNDPTNGGRALLLLEKVGLITLKPGVANPSLLDITGNTKNIKVVELEAPQLPRVLGDAAMAVINTDWIVIAKMDPKTAIVTESIDSPYANVFAIRKGDESREKLQQLVKIYRSDAVKSFIEEKFKGAVITAW